MIKAVIFDLDDTLYPELDYVKSGFRRVSDYMTHMYGMNITFDDLYSAFEVSGIDVFGRVLKAKNIAYTDEEMHELIEVYRNNIPQEGELQLFKGVREVIDYLKGKGYLLGIITDGRALSQNVKIDALGIRELFDKIIITDEYGVEYRKPHPMAFEKMSHALGVDYSEMVYVGDNRAKDFRIGGDYPIKTIEVLTQGKIHGDADYLDGVMPSKIIENITEIRGIL